jgi:hypothetical protein
MVEQHLRWMQQGAASPVLAHACQRLAFEWRAISRTAALAAPRSTLH